MTNRTVRRRFLLLSVFPRNRNEPCGPIFFEGRRIVTDYLQMGFVWEMNCKLAGAVPSWFCSISHVAETRKQESHGIAWRYCDVAIRTNLWRRSLAREKLLPVAIETRRMLRKLGHIGKSSLAFANFFPVGSGKLVARIACQFLFGDVSSMRKVRIVSAGLNASLSRGRNGAQKKANRYECC